MILEQLKTKQRDHSHWNVTVCDGAKATRSHFCERHRGGANDAAVAHLIVGPLHIMERLPEKSGSEMAHGMQRELRHLFRQGIDIEPAEFRELFRLHDAWFAGEVIGHVDQ